jgi:hypothetical protein
MAAPTTAADVKKTLANPEPSTHGPMSEVAARLVDARSVRHSGLDLLTWSSSHFDPEQS